jgi:hypothetical protein
MAPVVRTQNPIKIGRGTRVTGDARLLLLADLRYRYLDLRMPLRVIAADTGRAYSTVHRMLTLDGVLLRSKGGKPRQS